MNKSAAAGSDSAEKTPLAPAAADPPATEETGNVLNVSDAAGAAAGVSRRPRRNRARGPEPVGGDYVPLANKAGELAAGKTARVACPDHEEKPVEERAHFGGLRRRRADRGDGRRGVRAADARAVGAGLPVENT